MPLGAHLASQAPAFPGLLPGPYSQPFIGKAKHGDFPCAKAVRGFNLFFSMLISLASVSAGRLSVCPKIALHCSTTRCAEGRDYADLRGDRKGR